jgi:hypothetical protein
MSKLRLVHKGLEVLEDFQELPGEESVNQKESTGAP